MVEPALPLDFNEGLSELFVLWLELLFELLLGVESTKATILFLGIWLSEFLNEFLIAIEALSIISEITK
ncbi:hypothetical protein Q4561_04925 [Alteromonas sp. 1_MG-2023]|uniref:hypothetical protein n=1 Tax=Alteromonas sp. 1_MG-2023 TaxID=3062669 RepID=UPI0026E3C324|nr:hypothetical protein [Alteromonas sp. 1_MG-2023]MDO6566391.1 hypothetical protein [Alteromonas sp. 1_MG-2023]